MHHNPRKRIRWPARFALCGAFAAAAAFGVADAAGAKIPEKTIKSECRAANGGLYLTRVENGHRYSLCNYRDIDGNYYIDRYVDGEYVGES